MTHWTVPKQKITCRDLSQAEYHRVLFEAGLPPALAETFADADARAAECALFDGGREISRLIGRPAPPLSATVAAALQN